MIEPLKPGDDLFPYDVTYIDGEMVCTWRQDWNTEKQIDRKLHSLDYLVQFKENEGCIGVIRMIDAYGPLVSEHGTPKQKARLESYMARRDQWLRKSQQG